jgi:hypothetical protein
LKIDMQHMINRRETRYGVVSFSAGYFLSIQGTIKDVVKSEQIYIDVDINTSDTSTPTHNQISGPITRARVRELNNQVSSFPASYSSYLDNGNMYSVLLRRNDGQERNGVAFAPVTVGFQNSSSL